MKSTEFINEGWSQKYKNSINCSHPKGFSQKAHCAGKKKHNESIEMEMVCKDCGMCKTHGSLNEIKKGQKDSNGYTKCWPGKHAEGTKKGKNGGQVRNCKPNKNINEFATGRGGNGSGRWYTDDEITELVGDGWWEEMDISGASIGVPDGDLPKEYMMHQAQAWLDDQGYNVEVHNIRLNDDDCDWFIIGDFYNPGFAKKGVHEAANAAQQAAIAVNMKKHHQKPKHMAEDEQIDGMARGEIKAIIDNALHIQKALEHGISLDGWMYSYVTTSNDHLNSVAEQIGNPDIEEANRQFDMIEAMMEDLAAQNGLDSDTIWDLFETVSDSELLSETAAWQKSSGKNKNGGLNQKGVNSYRKEHPGSKLQTAVTTKPSKLKPGSKAAKRRKSFCARMKGMKKSRTSAKTAHDPNSRINKSLRKWNC
jgi:hypothetical protein